MWRYRTSKYGNTKLDTPSGKFDSRLEYQHYLDLSLLQKSGKITRLNRQVRFKLGQSDKCKVHYVADFVYYDLTLEKWVVADTKGMETTDFKIKLKWLLDSYDGFVFKLIFKRGEEFYEPFNETKRFVSEVVREHERKIYEKAMKGK